MDFYKNQTTLNPTIIDGVGPWTWPKHDRGAAEGIDITGKIDPGGWTASGWVLHHKENLVKLFSNRNKKVVVQAGGCAGLYPRLLSNIFEVVYTFEPDKLNFYCLINNCQKNNIIAINGALGSHHSMATMNVVDSGNIGMHKVMQIAQSIIPVFTIDDLALNHCDLIFLDVEGYEYDVIQGAINTIAKFRPVLILETYSDSIAKKINQFGYDFAGKWDRDSVLVPRDLNK
jgi:FkbM family methyltransferase